MVNADLRHQRIGVFGGSFDPPHMGHLGVAQQAMAQLALDRLQVIPTGNAWYKTRSLTDGEHRMAMARLAFAACPGVVVDDQEINRLGTCYTIDTLRQLQQTFPNADFFLIMGADQAAKFSTWHQWQDILVLAQLAVVDRQQIAANKLLEQGIDRFTVLQMPAIPISATAIRDQLSHGVVPISLSPNLLAPAVARYIQHHQLYKALS
jgi:nicotinate-nucleotide adenylyltransferase